MYISLTTHVLPVLKPVLKVMLNKIKFTQYVYCTDIDSQCVIVTFTTI